VRTLSATDLIKFSLRLGLFLLPAVLIAGSFFIADPFKVIYHYERFYDGSHQPGAALNRGYVSADIYVRQREKYRYDSFIFGSSRSLAFLTEDWKKYIGVSSPFHFDASGESLFGIWSTVKFISRSNTPIRNALIVLDPLLFKEGITESKEFLKMHHPDITGMAKIKFYFQFLRGYLSEGFFIRYWDFRLFKTFRPYMGKYINTHRPSCDPITNDCLLAWRDERIAAGPEVYFSNKNIFYPREHLEKHGHDSVIKEKHLLMLREIKKIFEEHNTHFKIVINPLYDQKRIDGRDLEVLQSLFGADNVHDYSGVNAVTQDVENYYEPRHYRPQAARKILEEIYAV